jgi:hypothetical protein
MELKDVIWAGINLEKLIDNAACASQCKALLEDNVREAIKLNIIQPLLDLIE